MKTINRDRFWGDEEQLSCDVHMKTKGGVKIWMKLPTEKPNKLAMLR